MEWNERILKHMLKSESQSLQICSDMSESIYFYLLQDRVLLIQIMDMMPLNVGTSSFWPCIGNWLSFFSMIIHVLFNHASVHFHEPMSTFKLHMLEVSAGQHGCHMNQFSICVSCSPLLFLSYQQFTA